MLLCPFHLFSQIRVSGFVKDNESGEALIFASIVEKGTNNYTLSDNNGYFSLITSTPCSLEVTYVGFNPLLFEINSKKDTLVNILLSTDIIIEDVIVKATRTLLPNITSLSGKELQYLPSIGARPDLLKTLQLYPGIQTQNEGSSLLLVRGGDPGQNLYLIDNVPLIYVNHLGGFMSVFNPDIINNVDVYKAGFPAHFGGKLSSILDITQREGNTNNTKGSFSFGLTDMSLSLEGPVKEKSSYIVTGRTSFLGLFSMLASQTLPGNYYTLFYGFHDINAKYSWRPNTKNSLHINFYQGDDMLQYKVKQSELKEGEKTITRSTWGNWLLSAQYKSIITSKLRSTNTLSYTRYRLKNIQDRTSLGDAGYSDYFSEYLSSLKNASFHSNWKYDIAKPYSIEYGVLSSYLFNVPNKYHASNQSVGSSAKSLKSFQADLYIENKLKLGNCMLLNMGLRNSNYFTEGYSANNLEPRINLSCKMSPNYSLNFSYMRAYQYTHLLFTSGSISNNEVWISSDHQIQPSRVDQFATGIQSRMMDGMFDIEFNLYYKDMTNLTTYKDGYSDLMGSPNWHSKVTSNGQGISKGLELYLKKNYGKVTGFMGYSFSHATRKFDDINSGEEYLFDFDRPHCFSTNVQYALNKKWKMNLAWVYQSGIPYTPAIGRQNTIASGYDAYYNSDIYEALIYGPRNSDRLSPYHRLDISCIYSTETKRNNAAEWIFSIYNAYNRQNAYYYYYNTNNTGEMIPPDYYETYKPLSLYQISFLPIIPSISYKVYFNKESNGNKTDNTIHKLKKWFFYENE